MAGAQTLEPVRDAVAASSAVAWINGRQASVAAMSGDGRISTCEISRGSLSEGAYLAQVVRFIGYRQRVVILGPSSVRLALEREYVACSNVLIGWSTSSRPGPSHIGRAGRSAAHAG